MDVIFIKILKLVSRRFILLGLKLFITWSYADRKTFLYGSTYGNWRLPRMKQFNANAQVLVGGVGEDISFELDLINRYDQTKVLLYDFTPKSLKFLQHHFAIDKVNTDVLEINDNITYHNYGLACYEGDMLLAFPENPQHVSLRQAKSEQEDIRTIKLPVLSIIDEIYKIDESSRAILKLDIEGSEAEMLSQHNLIDEFATFDVILIELDFLKFIPVANWILPLRGLIALYKTHKIFYVSDFNIGFIKR